MRRASKPLRTTRLSTVPVEGPSPQPAALREVHAQRVLKNPLPTSSRRSSSRAPHEFASTTRVKTTADNATVDHSGRGAVAAARCAARSACAASAEKPTNDVVPPIIVPRAARISECGERQNHCGRRARRLSRSSRRRRSPLCCGECMLACECWHSITQQRWLQWRHRCVANAPPSSAVRPLAANPQMTSIRRIRTIADAAPVDRYGRGAVAESRCAAKSACAVSAEKAHKRRRPADRRPARRTY